MRFLSKKSPRGQALLEIFNRGFRKLQESGKYDEYFGAFSKRGLREKTKIAHENTNLWSRKLSDTFKVSGSYVRARLQKS